MEEQQQQQQQQLWKQKQHSMQLRSGSLNLRLYSSRCVQQTRLDTCKQT